MQIPEQSQFYTPATIGLVLLPIKNANFQNIFAKNQKKNRKKQQKTEKIEKKFQWACEKERGRETTFCLLINKWISQKTLTAEIDKQKQKTKTQKTENKHERLLRKSQRRQV